MLKGKFSDGVW